MEPSRFEAFKERFEEVVCQSILPEQLQPQIQVDLQVHLREITPKLARILRQFAPFGPGNPNPVFEAGPLSDTGFARMVGSDGAHLKLAVKQEEAGPVGGIGFGLGDMLPELQGGAFNAVFSVEENSWQGRKSLQLKIKDFKGTARLEDPSRNIPG